MAVDSGNSTLILLPAGGGAKPCGLDPDPKPLTSWGNMDQGSSSGPSLHLAWFSQHPHYDGSVPDAPAQALPDAWYQ